MATLPGVQWIKDVDAVEFQQASGLQLDSQTLSMSTSTDIRVCVEDMWKALRGILGLQEYSSTGGSGGTSSGNTRRYLGAPHPLFQDTQDIYDDTGTVIGTERVPMVWADSVSLTPIDDWYRGVDGEIAQGDGGNPQITHFKNVRLHINYSNDPIHFSRIKCSWQPNLQKEEFKNGTLYWTDESKTGSARFNPKSEFKALDVQKNFRNLFLGDIVYSVAMYVNPTNPGCLPAWCEPASQDDLTMPLAGAWSIVPSAGGGSGGGTIGVGDGIVLVNILKNGKIASNIVEFVTGMTPATAQLSGVLTLTSNGESGSFAAGSVINVNSGGTLSEIPVSGTVELSGDKKSIQVFVQAQGGSPGGGADPNADVLALFNKNFPKSNLSLYGLLGAVNDADIELFPYFGDYDEIKKRIPISNPNIFLPSDVEGMPRIAEKGTLLFSDVSCTTEFRPWSFGLDQDAATANAKYLGIKMFPVTFLHFRLTYKKNGGWAKFWNGMEMDYGYLWWQSANGNIKQELKLTPERDFTPIQQFIRDNIAW